jgi:anti-anti-sigma regulatory factor
MAIVESPSGATGEFAFVLVHEASRGTVAWLRGDLDATTTPALLRHLIDTLDLPLTSLVLDLRDVRDIDDHGRAVLEVARKRARMRGITLAIDHDTGASKTVSLQLSGP